MLIIFALPVTRESAASLRGQRTFTVKSIHTVGGRKTGERGDVSECVLLIYSIPGTVSERKSHMNTELTWPSQ